MRMRDGRAIPPHSAIAVPLLVLTMRPRRTTTMTACSFLNGSGMGIIIRASCSSPNQMQQRMNLDGMEAAERDSSVLPSDPTDERSV